MDSRAKKWFSAPVSFIFMLDIIVKNALTTPFKKMNHYSFEANCY